MDFYVCMKRAGDRVSKRKLRKGKVGQRQRSELAGANELGIHTRGLVTKTTAQLSTQHAQQKTSDMEPARLQDPTYGGRQHES